MKFPEASSLWTYAAVFFLLLVIAPFLREFMRKAGADSYEWVRRAVRRDQAFDDEVGDEEDWSRRKVVLTWIQWPIAMIVVVVMIKLPELVMPPVLWHTMEALFFAYIGWTNLYHWFVIDTFERTVPNGRKIIWGKYDSRKRSTKRHLMVSAIMLSVILTAMTLGERNVYQELARNYCLSDLPSEFSRYMFSFTKDIPANEVSDEKLRDLMRNAEANEQVEAGLCRR